jgi:hypothetical protein
MPALAASAWCMTFSKNCACRIFSAWIDQQGRLIIKPRSGQSKVFSFTHVLPAAQ